MPEMIADVALKYPRVMPGERFQASDKKAKLFALYRKAHLAPIDDEELPAVEPQKRRYRRRDMRAGD